jgi:hypothetical protein
MGVNTERLVCVHIVSAHTSSSDFCTKYLCLSPSLKTEVYKYIHQFKGQVVINPHDLKYVPFLCRALQLYSVASQR